jgi:hypothetical protein
MVFISQKMLLGWKIKENVMGGAYCTYEMESAREIFVGKRQKTTWVDIDVDGEII